MSKLDEERVVYSLPSVISLWRCPLTNQKTVRDKADSMAHRVNAEQANITRTFLNPVVCLQKRLAGQGCCAVSKFRLDAFADFNCHGLFM